MADYRTRPWRRVDGSLHSHRIKFELVADQSQLPDTVIGFAEGADHLSFSGETSAGINSVVASQQLVNGNTVLTFPDSTSLVLAGITRADTNFFA